MPSKKIRRQDKERRDEEEILTAVKSESDKKREASLCWREKKFVTAKSTVLLFLFILSDIRSLVCSVEGRKGREIFHCTRSYQKEVSLSREKRS